MTFSEARKIFKAAAGTGYRRPVESKSYTRNGAMHLIGHSGDLLAVILPGGSCVYGIALHKALQQLQLGLQGDA